MSDERIQLLQAMPIFGAIDRTILEFLLERVSQVSAEKGGLFFREGSSGGSAFVLEEGRVSILKRWNGRDYVLGQLETGDCFGEVALLDLGPRSASVVAETHCTALELTAADLFEVSKRNLEQFAIIYMNLGRELSRRLRVADARLFLAKQQVNPFAEEYTFNLG